MEKNSAILGIIAVLVIVVVILAAIFTLGIDFGLGSKDDDDPPPPPPTNEPPIAQLWVSETTVHVGEAITFDATNSTDPDGEIEDYIWDFGDGGIGERGINKTIVQHTYNYGGEYPVNLTVRDDSGSDNNLNSTYQIIRVIPNNVVIEGGIFVTTREGAPENDSVEFTVEEEVLKVNISLSIWGGGFESGIEDAEFEISIYNPYNHLMDSEEITMMGSESLEFEFDKKDLKAFGEYKLEVTCTNGGGYISYNIKVIYQYE